MFLSVSVGGVVSRVSLIFPGIFSIIIFFFSIFKMNSTTTSPPIQLGYNNTTSLTSQPLSLPTLRSLQSNATVVLPDSLLNNSPITPAFSPGSFVSTNLITPELNVSDLPTATTPIVTTNSTLTPYGSTPLLPTLSSVKLTPVLPSTVSTASTVSSNISTLATRSSLPSVTLTPTIRTPLPSANLQSTSIPSVNLQSANLPSANLPSANLPSANLPSATLPSVTLTQNMDIGQPTLKLPVPKVDSYTIQTQFEPVESIQNRETSEIYSSLTPRQEGLTVEEIINGKPSIQNQSMATGKIMTIESEKTPLETSLISIDTTSSGSSVLSELIQPSTEAVFTSPGASPIDLNTEVRSDSVLEKLLENGIVVENRMYSESKLTHLLVKTLFGDKAIVNMDDDTYKNSFPSMNNDIVMRKNSVTLVPQETKVGVLNCLDYNICGAAFICNDNICITEKSTTDNIVETTFTEENYVYKQGSENKGGKIGNSLVAYPIVKMSSLLEHPRETIRHIEMVAKEMSNLSFLKLKHKQEQNMMSVTELLKYLKYLRGATEDAQVGLNKDISVLDSICLKYLTVKPNSLPDNVQQDYYVILRGLAHKKDLRNKFVNVMYEANTLLDNVNMLLKDVDELTLPVIDEYEKFKGKVNPDI